MPDSRASIFVKNRISGTYLKNKFQELEEFTIEDFRNEGHALLFLNPKTDTEGGISSLSRDLLNLPTVERSEAESRHLIFFI